MYGVRAAVRVYSYAYTMLACTILAKPFEKKIYNSLDLCLLLSKTFACLYSQCKETRKNVVKKCLIFKFMEINMTFVIEGN